MKLIAREPTGDMIASMWAEFKPMEPPGIMRKVFQAAFDAAPEIQQEPIGHALIVDGRVEEVGKHPMSMRYYGKHYKSQPIYAFPPDASALKAHDAALLERCAAICDEYADDPVYCGSAIRELKQISRN